MCVCVCILFLGAAEQWIICAVGSPECFGILVGGQLEYLPEMK